MKALALIFLAACTSEAGSDCPPVPQPGQTCKANASCIYPKASACSPSLQTKCTNGRFVLVQTPAPPTCDASTDAPVDAPKDSPQDSAQDSPQDG